MKTKIIVALVAAVALCVGAYYFFTKINIEPPIPHTPINNIVGAWKIDSVYKSKDSSKIADFLFAAFDSSIVKFNADSSLHIISQKQTDTLNYIVNKDSLFINPLKKADTFYLKFINDSIFSATSTDSSTLILKRTNIK